MACIRLYHGSDVAIEHPDVTRNTGFADLGQGFYLTDDHDAARRRAASRARRTGAAQGVVSAFDLDADCLPWVTVGEGADMPSDVVGGRFCLRFAANVAGMEAWVNYIVACRAGRTEVGSLGSPCVVRAWIATEEVEFVSSGLLTAAEVAGHIDASELVVQYCLLDQDVVDASLSFAGAEHVRL